MHLRLAMGSVPSTTSGTSSPTRGSCMWMRSAATALAVVGLATSISTAQSATGGNDATPQPAANQVSDLDLLRDFIHYVRINRADLAEAMAQQLLDRKISGQDFVRLVEAGGELNRFEDSVGRAIRIGGNLETTAASLSKLYEAGKRERARDPKDIAANIKDLTSGQARARVLAEERLRTAGEYAVPQLLEALLDRKDAMLQSAVQRVLIGLGAQVVAPLSAALPKLDAGSQERVADILGLAGHTTAIPALADARDSTKSEAAKTACVRAIERLNAAAAGTPTTSLYNALAERYYAQSPEVTSFPGEDFQILWNFEPSTGLVPQAIRTQVFHEAAAMRASERALALTNDNAEALSLWLSSNLRREIQTPSGYDNPAYPASRRDAMYYAIAAGPAADQAVLARAIAARDTLLARKAIAALEKTAGGRALIGDAVAGGSRTALLDALDYPNRRVQYEAALVLGKAQPTVPFAGAERVVPTLASAIREASSKYAVIVANAEVYQTLRKVLEGSGYSVLPQGRTLEDLAAPIAEAAAVDLIVAVQPSIETGQNFVSSVRQNPKLTASPVLLLSSPENIPTLRRSLDADPGVAVRASAISEAQISKAVTELVLSATGGPIEANEAQDYAIRSLTTLRELAISGNPVLQVADALLPLSSALGEAKGTKQLQIADILSRINDSRAQVSLMDAALNANGGTRIELIAKVGESAKRFGSMLEQRQINRVIEMASGKDEIEATAAAALAGSLNLPNTTLVPLILEKK
ncbi:MAG: hypothetical protein SFY96_13410 [Planctomycetota bacterium]|nr:hypothetical protein [Planctomycetota bacterium]